MESYVRYVRSLFHFCWANALRIIADRNIKYRDSLSAVVSYYYSLLHLCLAVLALECEKKELETWFLVAPKNFDELDLAGKRTAVDNLVTKRRKRRIQMSHDELLTTVKRLADESKNEYLHKLHRIISNARPIREICSYGPYVMITPIRGGKVAKGSPFYKAPCKVELIEQIWREKPPVVRDNYVRSYYMEYSDLSELLQQFKNYFKTKVGDESMDVVYTLSVSLFNLLWISAFLSNDVFQKVEADLQSVCEAIGLNTLETYQEFKEKHSYKMLLSKRQRGEEINIEGIVFE